MEARTSETNPLRIARIERPGLGPLGLTLCPGKKQIGASSGVWMRDLGQDLDRVAEEDFAAVLGLMTAQEYDELQVPLRSFRAACADRGLEFIHLPIVDVSVPDDDFERRWLHAGARSRYLLRQGRGVLVHCKGGLGRSGLVAARILVELGLDAERAIAEVRAARRGAIETPDQERHVVRRERELLTRVDLAREERAVGVMLAGAIGDALGAAVEFDSLARIRERFGPRGIRAYARCYGGLGRVTDDSQMTLFTAEGLLEALAAPGEPGIAAVTAAIDAAYRRWRMTQEAPPSAARGRSGLLGRAELWSQRAPGNTCLSALQAARSGRPERPLNDSKGCGGIMRVAPIGLVGPRFASVTLTFELALRSAALTHGHPSGQYPAAVFAVMIQELVAGREPRAALASGMELLPEDGRGAETRALVEAALAFDGPDSLVPEILEELGRGFVAEEALGIAIACAFAAADLDEALHAAVNHGGDSDSTGLLAGQLRAAGEGAGAIRSSWLEELELRDLHLETGRALARAARFDLGPERRERLRGCLPFFVAPPTDLVREERGLRVYRDEVGELGSLLHREGLTRIDDDTRPVVAAARLLADESLLAEADEETLRRLLVGEFCGERFASGALGEAIVAGRIAAILRRLVAAP